ncbi:DUF5694 domain-containing protein [Haloferax sp. DFSO60]|uniref:DUF5694 domain-containing protein n=1 Tax=Haloferax sp. DFSO60 TaxID=3388652 RepID=UPI003979A2D4
MPRPNVAARKSPTWPTPTPEQIEVVILGTYHMDNPGLDAANVDADDVLSDDRQRELTELVSNLEAIDPDFVAVERPASAADAVQDAYLQYRDGGFSYGEAHALNAMHPERDDARQRSRSEVVQIGFRLADRFGHDRVVPVDVPEDLGDSPDLDALEADGFEPTPKRDVPRLDTRALEESLTERLKTSSIPAYHRFLNEEAALHYNDGMYDQFLQMGTDENYAGPDALARWYRRNLRMVHNIWRAVDDDTERVLFIVGSGHVHILRHLLTEFPQFCPVSPLPYLPRED